MKLISLGSERISIYSFQRSHINMNFREQLTEKTWLIDGLKEKGLQQSVSDSGKPLYLYNLTHPDRVREIYAAYSQAGAELLISNTYQALRPALKSCQAVDYLTQLNIQGVRLAQQKDRPQKPVLGTVGPADLDIVPWGPVAFDEAVAVYQEQIKILIAEKVAALFYYGFADIQNLRAAVIAARKVSDDIPLITLATFDSHGKLQSGTDVATYSTILTGLNVDVLGANHAAVSLSVRNNINRPVVSLTGREPDSSSIEGQLQAGIQLFCCSADILPDGIKKVSQLISGKKTSVPDKKFPLRISSATTTLEIGTGLPFVKVGERINPTGRKLLAKSLAEQDTALILKDVYAQEAAGAHALDVNVGAPLVNEQVMMQKALIAIQEVIPLPLVIDSTNPAVIETALKCYAGKALVNSLNGKEKQLAQLIPLVRKYGAAFIGLTIDESILGDADRKLQIAKYILKACKDHGLSREHIIIDTAAMAVATGPDTAPETLKAIRKIKDTLAVPVILGISNISFGLPRRSLVHNTFLSQAMSCGLDAAIINPLDTDVHATIAAASLLCGRDPHGLKYIDYFRKQLPKMEN